MEICDTYAIEDNSDYQSNKIEEEIWQPRVLVVGPGGIKGLKVLGFLSPLEDFGLLNKIDTYCGVSIGAIITLLIICGYQIREIVGEAVIFDIFKEISTFDFQSIIINKGLISNEPAKKRLTQLVINKFGNVPSLYGLYMRTGKSLTIVTLNATDEECVMMNPFTHPDVSCVDATMFSMNIPYVFYQLIYNNKTYVDGALANPYPVDYFDDGNTNILGIYMKTCYSEQLSTISSHNIGPFLQKNERKINPLPLGIFSLKIIHSLMDQRRYTVIQQSSSKCRHICLITKNTDSLGLGSTMSVEDKAHLLVEGYNDGKNFLSQVISGQFEEPKIPSKLSYKYPHYYMDDNTNDPL